VISPPTIYNSSVWPIIIVLLNPHAVAIYLSPENHLSLQSAPPSLDPSAPLIFFRHQLEALYQQLLPDMQVGYIAHTVDNPSNVSIIVAKNRMEAIGVATEPP